MEEVMGRAHCWEVGGGKADFGDYIYRWTTTMYWNLNIDKFVGAFIADMFVDRAIANQ
jgi:hypothetical protein